MLAEIGIGFLSSALGVAAPLVALLALGWLYSWIKPNRRN